jgi:hypothetical protein
MTTVTRQIHFEMKDRRKRIVDGAAPPAQEVTPEGRVPRIAKLMALAIRFEKLLRDGTVTNQSELAHLAQVTQPRMTQIMNLLHLAPDIQEEILFLPPVTEGRDPVTERGLRSVVSSRRWDAQRNQWRVLACGSYPELRPHIREDATGSAGVYNEH